MATPKKATTGPKTAKSGTSRPDRDTGDTSRFISLANGSFTYVSYPRGTTTKVATNSEQFTELIAIMVADGLGAKVKAELTEHSERWPDSAWPRTLANLEAKKVFEPAG
jgi:hypothetical protein